MARFERPFNNMWAQDVYGLNEVGISHPSVDGFIKISDNGDIQIVVDDGCAIILNAKKRTITFLADEVRFLTKEGNAIRWNNRRFNAGANVFSQPSLVDLDTADQHTLYTGTDEYY